jgi:hypothetical protein
VSHSLEPEPSTCFQEPENELHQLILPAGLVESAYLAAGLSLCEQFLQGPQHREHGLRVQLAHRF